MKEIHYDFLTCLTKDEVTAIIARQKGKGLSYGIYGNASGPQIRICSKPGYRNFFIPVFYGVITESPNGTLISGHFQLAQSVKVFMWVWRVILLMFAVLVIIFPDRDTKILLTLLAMILFSFALTRFGWFMGKDCKEEILNFIKVNLIARPLFDVQ